MEALFIKQLCLLSFPELFVVRNSYLHVFKEVACNVSQSFLFVIAINMNDAGPRVAAAWRLPLAVRNAGIVINAPSSLQLFSLRQVQGGPARMAQQELHRTDYDFLAFTCVEITGAPPLHPGCALGTCSSAGVQMESYALFKRTYDRNAY